MDVISNRLFIEPALGMGYPTEDIPALKRLQKYFREGDAERLKFDFDFIGVQNYFRSVAKKSLFPPFLWAKEIPASERGVPVNEMNGEVSPDGMYKILKQFGTYQGVKRIIITENGTCFNDIVEDFEGVEDICLEIKRCKWHKVNVKSLEETSYDRNYNKYNVVYYPMVSYYAYIKKYGHYLLGYKKDLENKMKYLVYAIPGCNCKIDQPFEGKSGFVTWVPGKRGEEYFGYWLMFYDFKNSTIVIPVK